MRAEGTTDAPRVTRFGHRAWLIAFDGGLDAAVNASVIALAERIRALRPAGVVEIVPAASSLVVHVDPDVFDEAAFELSVSRPVVAKADQGGSRLHRIPVCYEPPLALDLADVARASGCSHEEVIERHQAVEYRVFMIGFLPGFPYLGLLDGRIAVPRRPHPRLAVPAGSVGIAGRQTGVYPMESPGGWQIIGRTPLAMFDALRDSPSRLGAGDRVRFVRIDAREFSRAGSKDRW